MRFDIYAIIKSIGVSDFSKILWGLLLRDPIIIIGSNKHNIDLLSSFLSNLLSFRKEIVFWKSFTSREELYSILDFELQEPNEPRIIIRSPAEVSSIALTTFDNFSGWIIGILENSISELKMPQNSIIIRLEDSIPKLVSKRNRNIYFEKIITKIVEKTKVSVEHVRRHLEKEIHRISKDVFEEVLSLDSEFKMIIHDLFDEAMQDFYHASRRAYFLLMKIKILRSLNVDIQIGKRNFIELIGISESALEYILLFIQSEWNEEFRNCVRDSVLSNIGIYVESLWG